MIAKAEELLKKSDTKTGCFTFSRVYFTKSFEVPMKKFHATQLSGNYHPLTYVSASVAEFRACVCSTKAMLSSTIRNPRSRTSEREREKDSKRRFPFSSAESETVTSDRRGKNG